MKDKQIIISRLVKGEKGVGISKQQISDLRRNKDKILKFTDGIETSDWLKLDKSRQPILTKRKQAVLSMKDKQIIISRLDKGEKRTNLAQEFGISKQQISDLRKNKDKILKFTDGIETSDWLKQKSSTQTNKARGIEWSHLI